MNNEVQVFNNDDFSVRTLTDDNGNIWFVAKDVCEILGLENVSMALQKLDDDEKDEVKNFDVVGRKQVMTTINESGLYTLVMRSNKPQARLFRKWVTSEVLPAIRKHGAYMTPDTIEKTLSDPDFIIKLATELKAERAKTIVLEEKIELDRPKVKFADSVAVANTDIPIGNLARILKANGINTGRTRLFEWLRDNGYLIRARSSEYNTPTQKSLEMGLMTLKEHVIETGYDTMIKPTPKLTPKGQQFFINLFIDHPEYLNPKN